MTGKYRAGEREGETEAQATEGDGREGGLRLRGCRGVKTEVWQEMKCVIWEKCSGRVATVLFHPQSLHCGEISILGYKVCLAKEHHAGVMGRRERRAGGRTELARVKKNVCLKEGGGVLG